MTIAILIAVPALAEVEPDFGIKVDITFDESGVDYNNAEYPIDPAISPDGEWIAFTTHVTISGYSPYSNRYAIWLVPAEGGEAKLLYTNAFNVHCLRFTPDSKTLAFQHTVDDYDQKLERVVYSTKTLYGIDIDTGEVSVILEGAGRAHWSNDSRYISYINYDERIFTDELQAEHQGVPTIYDTVTDETRYLTDENLGPDPLKYLDPTISPDNKYVYVNIMERIDNNTVSQLYRMPFEGGELEQLTFFEEVRFGYCRNMNFSPDGLWLLFDYCFGVYVYNTFTDQTFDAFTGEETNKPYPPPFDVNHGWETSPNWRPDGTTFCYSLMDGGRNDYRVGYEIYICGFNAAKYAVLPTLVENAAPSSFIVLRNYPNPFNPATTIEFSIPEAGFVDLVIYDITGRKIRELVSGDVTPGVHSVFWDGRDENGSPVSSGVFISRLKTGDNVVSNRMMLVK